jgi:hypothetical protein
MSLIQVAPKILPPLDPQFRPAYLGNRNFETLVQQSGQGVKLIFAVEAAQGSVTRFETVAYPSGHPLAAENLAYAERVLKFLLWARGGWKVTVAGPQGIAKHLKQVYSAKGARKFDAKFMADVYEKKAFVVKAQAFSASAKTKLEQSGGRAEILAGPKVWKRKD